MLYRETGQFKTSYVADQAIFPIAQDRWFVLALVAFAFLGYLTWTGRAGNEPGATGAAGPRVLGSITPA